MKTIYYGVAGEGRGHAARTQGIVDVLRQRYRVALFSSGQAHDLLRQVYHDSEVALHEIPGLEFGYDRHGRQSYWITGLQVPGTALRGWRTIDTLTRCFRDDPPDLIISDFEPLLPRVARRLRIPYLLLDHQSFLLDYDLSHLPWQLRSRLPFLRSIVRLLYGWGEQRRVCSSFFFPPLRRGCTRTVQVGVMLREAVRRIPPRDGGFLLVYMRRHLSPALERALRAQPLPVRIYGIGEQPARDNLRFCPVDTERFVADLASCRALVATAGNTLVGEALYLQKPILALPEPGNVEQLIHAHFIAHSGCGEVADPATVDAATVQNFLARLGQFRPYTHRHRLQGLEATIEAIEQTLEQLITTEVTCYSEPGD